MLTSAQVRAARPRSWQTTAAAWRLLAEAILQRAEDVRDCADRLPGSWRGSGADAAQARLHRLCRALECAATACLAVDQILAAFADRVASAQPLDPEPAALRRAGEADDSAARRLRDLLPDLLPDRADGVASPAPPWPSPTADPADVRRWWDALTAADRRRLLADDPARLGWLDGIPVDVRDRANRLVLARQRQTLAAATDAASSARLRALDAVAARLAGKAPARAYLLGLDASGDGRAVVAIGDPDRADNVLTYVPGTGARLADLTGHLLLPAADRLAATAGGSTAVVVWLGYDAPDNPVVASSGTYARRAEDGLDRFEDGLRATHEGPRAHQSVLGHSYGSTVVGYTARDRGLDVDDVIFVGSPGVGVAHAAVLNLPPGHVWASTATYDPIRLTTAGRALASVLAPPAGRDLWFGADPSRSGFGGRVFNGAPGSPLHPLSTHDGYFDEANPAFGEVVRIAVTPP
jgi:hypothetical protein